MGSILTGNALWTPYKLILYHVSSEWHISWLRRKFQSRVRHSWHKVSIFSMAYRLCTMDSVCRNLVLSQRLTNHKLTELVCCLLNSGRHICWSGVMSVQGGTLADYDQNIRHGWDSPDTKFQLLQWPETTVLLINFLPSLPVTAERGSAPSAHYPPERATSGIATCSVVGDTYRPVAKLSPALGWWTLPYLACLWARIRARPAKQSTGWRNTVTNV